MPTKKDSSRPRMQNRLGVALTPSDAARLAPEYTPKPRQVRPENPNIDLYGPDTDPRSRRCGGCKFLDYHALQAIKYTCAMRVLLPGESAEHFLLWDACSLYRFANE